MSFDTPTLIALINGCTQTIVAHEGELTDLDSAIGDGDHGANMKRGFSAIHDDIANLAAKPVDEALKAAGMLLVMKVGGASGPLFGTLLLTLGKTLGAEPDLPQAIAAFGAAIDAVKARGKSDAGAKTMLDVLIPIHQALVNGETNAETLRALADGAANDTIPMLATRGRASFLGERSIGHLDPGARSTALIFNSMLDVLETRK